MIGLFSLFFVFGLGADFSGNEATFLPAHNQGLTVFASSAHRSLRHAAACLGRVYAS